MMREERMLGYFVGFEFTVDALFEISGRHTAWPDWRPDERRQDGAQGRFVILFQPDCGAMSRRAIGRVFEELDQLIRPGGDRFGTKDS